MAWKTIKKMRKNMYRNLGHKAGTFNVFLPSYTKGVSWQGSNMLVCSNQLRTLEGESKYQGVITKKNDDSFDINIGSYRFAYRNVGAYLTFENQGQNSNEQSILVISKEFQDGFKFKTQRPLMLMLSFAGMMSWGFDVGGIGLDIYSNGKKVLRYDDMWQMPGFAINESFFFINVMWSDRVIVEPNEKNEVHIQIKSFQPWYVKGLMGNTVMNICYFDEETDGVQTGVDVHAFAFEEV